jgi:ribonuclease P protein component
VLPAPHRMTRRDDFARAVRAGRRAGRPTLVAHLDVRSAARAAVPTSVRLSQQDDPARVGLVVSKAVGGAVTRNRVSRRLRHQMQTRVQRLAPGSLLVLRAQPAAASASSADLAADLDRVLDRLLGTAPEVRR